MCQGICKTLISHGFSAGENVPWEYRENEVSVGALYPTLEHLKNAVKRWPTLTTQRGFRVVKSSPRVYDVCFVKLDCAFRVHAYKGKWKNYFEVSVVVDHTCRLEKLDTSHRNLSSGFSASHNCAKFCL
jgi:hypothetical protein